MYVGAWPGTSTGSLTCSDDTCVHTFTHKELNRPTNVCLLSVPLLMFTLGLWFFFLSSGRGVPSLLCITVCCTCQRGQHWGSSEITWTPPGRRSPGRGRNDRGQSRLTKLQLFSLLVSFMWNLHFLLFFYSWTEMETMETLRTRRRRTPPQSKKQWHWPVGVSISSVSEIGESHSSRRLDFSEPSSSANTTPGSTTAPPTVGSSGRSSTVHSRSQLKPETTDKLRPPGPPTAGAGGLMKSKFVFFYRRGRNLSVDKTSSL